MQAIFSLACTMITFSRWAKRTFSYLFLTSFFIYSEFTWKHYYFRVPLFLISHFQKFRLTFSCLSTFSTEEIFHQIHIEAKFSSLNFRWHKRVKIIVWVFFSYLINIKPINIILFKALN